MIDSRQQQVGLVGNEGDGCHFAEAASSVLHMTAMAAMMYRTCSHQDDKQHRATGPIARAAWKARLSLSSSPIVLPSSLVRCLLTGTASIAWICKV